MNGNRFVLGTNAIIALLQGKQSIIHFLQDASWITISVISQLEFLSLANLSEQDRMLFQNFIERVHVIGLDAYDAIFLNDIITLRKTYRLKLPDAIIAATTLKHNATLITNDKQFQQIRELNVVSLT